MGKSATPQGGYYRVYLLHEGLKTPFIVFAASSVQAALKALSDAGSGPEEMHVHDIEGPYYNYCNMLATQQ